jgi:hypothetical protein
VGEVKQTRNLAAAYDTVLRRALRRSDVSWFVSLASIDGVSAIKVTLFSPTGETWARAFTDPFSPLDDHGAGLVAAVDAGLAELVA